MCPMDITGWREVRKKRKIYEAFGSEEALPLGYTYDSFIPGEEYEK